MAVDGFKRRDSPANAPRTSTGPTERRLAKRPGMRPSVQPHGRTARLETLHREAGVLTHDLNNLLNVILAANEALALALPDGSGSRELAEIGQDAAERSAELVRRLRDLSAPRPALGTSCDSAAAVQSVARLARLSVPAAVLIRCDLAEADLGCAADRAELDSALLNLCVNAGHAMPQGGVLALSAEAGEAHIVLRVRDTGCGMSPDILSRATDPYYTTRRGRGGTGLGLASVRDFVRRSGGEFELSSEEGLGTTATLVLSRA